MAMKQKEKITESNTDLNDSKIPAYFKSSNGALKIIIFSSNQEPLRPATSFLAIGNVTCSFFFCHM